MSLLKTVIIVMTFQPSLEIQVLIFIYLSNNIYVCVLPDYISVPNLILH